MKTLHIILRTCAKIQKASSGGNRPFGLDKETLILKCLQSLLKSCKGNEKRIFLEVVDDSSSKEFILKMKTILQESSLKFNLVCINVSNNGKSLEYCYNLAKKSKFDLIYFCEDDYFHLNHAISAIFDAYDFKIIGTDNFAIHPTDYPDSYIRLFPSYIFLSNLCHWRSIPATTGTFVIPRRYFLKYFGLFLKFAEFNKTGTGGEENSINQVWKVVPCISPVESIAAHMNKETLPPLVDWKNKLKFN